MKKVKNIFSKIGSKITQFLHFLTHNKVLNTKDNYLVLFNKLKIKITNKRRETFYGFLFISIWIFGFVFLTLIPLFTSLVYSFNRVIITGDGGISMVNNGINHYITIFATDLDFISYLEDFIVKIAIYVPIILVISMLIAISLNQKIKLRGFYRSIFFLPVIIASGPVINELIEQGAGTIPLLSDSGILETLENTLPRFLVNPINSLFNELIIILWFSGVQIVLFLAGLQKISGEIYEAAAIDGASPWEMFWKITLPSLRSIILVSAIYTIVTFATFSNNSVITHIRRTMFDPQKGYGYSSALAWIYFILVSVILLIALLLIAYRREKKDTYKKFQRKQVI